VKRGALARGGVAVPTAVSELLAEKAAREFLVGVAEVAAEREDAAVDAGFNFAFEEQVACFFDWPEVPVAGGAVPTQSRFELRDRAFDFGSGGGDSGCAQELQGEESGQPGGCAFAAPGTVGTLEREDRGGETLVRNASAFDGNCGRRGVG